MNKELINKYKPEFDHWLNGGSVLLGKRDLITNTIKWYSSIYSPFEEFSSSAELIIIFNDEFVELAKAIKDLETFSQNKIADVRATLTLLSDQTKTVCAELDRKVSIAKERRDIDNKAILDSVRTETQRVVDQASGVQYSQDLSQMGRVA